MRAGRARHPVAVMGMETVRDSQAGRTETPSRVIAARWWCHIEPLQGEEALTAMQTGATHPYRFTGRYRADVNEAVELLWRGRRFNIRSVVSPNERGRDLVVTADEVMN